MPKYDIDDKFLKTINLLYVEDDETVVDLIQMRFGNKFAKLISVGSAEEALEVFSSDDFDLVMTDYFLPNMNGLDLTREILNIKKDTPVILITGYADMPFLVEAINLGVTQFVAKPIQFKLLKNAIFNAVDRVVIANLQKKTREQELEILQYQEKYHSMQQELAFRKELHIIQNEVLLKYISPQVSDSFNYNGWNIAVFYESRDMVCGDVYSCRRIDQDNVLVFIADAMGKGISAAMSSILSASVINHLTNTQLEEGKFDFKRVIERYINFIKNNLLEDEIICLSLVWFNFKDNHMDYATFSMPRICVEYVDGTLKNIQSNNMPIMKFTKDFKITRFELADVSKILIYSDGLIESETDDGNIYSDFLEKDFLDSPFLKVFQQILNKRITTFDDDTTVFFIRRPFASVVDSDSINVATKIDELERVENFLMNKFMSYDINMEQCEYFLTAFTEVIMNAYEHGNLGIGFEEKHMLIKQNKYDDALIELESSTDKRINIRFIFCNDNCHKYVIVGVRDEGSGYPASLMRNMGGEQGKFCGRGLTIIGHYTDDFFFSEDRKELFIARVFDSAMEEKII